MAYKIKTTGIAAACTMLIAVDPDTGTVKDFASSSVNADMTVGANVTTGTQSWDGNTRHYWMLGAGTTSADFIAFGATKPFWTNNSAGLARTWVFCGELAGTSGRAFGDSASAYMSATSLVSGGSTRPYQIGGGYSSAQNGGLAAPTSGDKLIYGFSSVHGTYGAYFSAAHDAGAMTTGSVSTPTATGSSAAWDLDFVARRNDSTSHLQDKIHFIAIFADDLSGAEWGSLRDDWFNVLLEVDGGGGTPITFSGTIPTINFTIGAADDVDLSTYFGGTATPFTFGLDGASASLPSGVTLSGAGLLEWSGSGTAGTTTGVIVEGTDDDAATDSSNAFSVVIANPSSSPVSKILQLLGG